jgi:hypothetical protein
MSDRPQDTELRARFQAQRRVDASEAPAFAALLARTQAEAAHAPTVMATPRGRLRRAFYWSGLAAAAAIGTLLALPRAASDQAAFERAVRVYHSAPAMGAWRSPTDALLKVPGSQLISTVPSVGAQ